jgi:hypothetical protein
MVTVGELMNNPCKECGAMTYDFDLDGKLFRKCGHPIEKELK